ncbi:MAG: hypothetical protein WCW02_03290 [Candidatus Buchananbacteria bacterium]
MEITLIIFYYVYLILLGLFILFSFFNYYHLIRFGFWSWGNLGVMMFYAFITVAILIVTWSYLTKIDWQTPLTSFNDLSWKQFSALGNSHANQETVNTNIISY